MQKFSPDSNIWVYPINQTLNPKQRAILEQKLREFVGQWKAHGASVTGDFQIVDNRFVVLSADANLATASGCSIDSMMKAVIEALNQAGLKMADFSTIFYRENGQIYQASRLEFSELKTSGIVNDETKVYDLTPANLAAFLETGICLAYKDSWHKKVFG